MRKMFSTDHVGVRDRFRVWQEYSRIRLPPVTMHKLGEGAFDARWELASIGGLSVSRVSISPHRLNFDARSGRANGKADSLMAAFRLAGSTRCGQHDRAAVQRSGELVVLDGAAPLAQEFAEPTRTLRVELGRERLERMLGPARLFAALPVGADLPGASLARTFFEELARVHTSMTPEAADRMAGIGVDLLVAAVAERIARETPGPIQGTVTVQRAKAHIEANLGDSNLDPPRLAAAMSVSLRRLQELFHARGQHISEWIWQRRLEVAAQRLVDPGYAHISIGALAYGCGFVNQAHFSKRFRDRFGISPGEHQRAALLGSA